LLFFLRFFLFVFISFVLFPLWIWSGLVAGWLVGWVVQNLGGFSLDFLFHVIGIS